jgi:hypothetical protein
MYRQKLTDVPKHLLDVPIGIKRGYKWQSEYNVAAWLRFKQLSQELIKLYIHWKDDNGEQSICVDQTTVNSASLLLSGVARIKVTGPLQSISVALDTNNLSFTVDELFVQPTKTGIHTKQA